MNEEVSAELGLMLGFMLVLQIGIWELTRKVSEQVTDAYGMMDPVSPEETLELREFEALGKRWVSPAPKVDFGADDKHERDAEALCYVVSRFGCAAPGKSFRCN